MWDYGNLQITNIVGCCAGSSPPPDHQAPNLPWLKECDLVTVADSLGQLPQDPISPCCSPGTLHAGLEALVHQHPNILLELHSLHYLMIKSI